MSTLPALSESLVLAVARNDFMFARALAGQVAAKIGGDRGEKMRVALRGGVASPLKFWTSVTHVRRPWVPQSVADALADWRAEVTHAAALVAAGERVMPLLLSGPTRCGKTSMACALSGELGLGGNVFRMTLSQVVESLLGETSKVMQKALEEAAVGPQGVYLIDEIDGVAMRRGGGVDAGSKERQHALAALLTQLESLPPGLPLIATTNDEESIDEAVLGRFALVRWPGWNSALLGDLGREAFARSHGAVLGPHWDSYADAVKGARAERVAAILAAAGATP